jgi:arginase
MNNRGCISVLGAPMDLGAGRRGVDMGPSAMRVAGLDEKIQSLGYEVKDLGNIEVDQPEAVPEGPQRARYLPQIAQTCTRLAETIERVKEDAAVPLVLGGDHSIAIGTLTGVASHYRKRNQRVGLIWIDAHADMNTPETSPSGNVHGMPLACIIGMGPNELTQLNGFAPKVEARNVVLVGIRDVDQLERPYVRQTGVRAFTMREIDEMGMRAVMREALAIACDGTAGVHISFDMDAVDPREAPGVGTPVRGGLTYREAHLAMEMVCDSQQMLSMEVVEVNPVIDEANRTGILGVELVMSALGKRIL